ncbi:MAG: TonB-dependent receptor [Gemmatimonadetes bacterium]|nr:TonB-dependent receptor [Gemmatimonadota bacterium]
MRLSFRSILIVLLVAIAPFALHAQSGTAQSGTAPAAGRIVGRVIDAATGQGITDVAIQIVGTTTGGMSGLEGRFTLSGVTAGTVTLQARRIGFAPKTVTGIFVEPGKTVEQNISLAQAAAQLSAQMVTAAAERGSVSEALDAQRTATGVVSAVTAEQIAKSPDGDAAQAVKRVSGVTVQDGKYVFVRGLGERYTTSSLNGARVPSPEPEKRVVPLDMFPAGLLQSITTSKTFTPDLQGDFSGALVDIKTKEFPARRSFSIQAGSGYAAGATGSQVTSATATGGEELAMVNHGRDLPTIIRNLGSFKNINLNQGDMNILVGSLRNSWTPTVRTAAPLMNGSASIGGNDPVLFGHRLGYLFSGSITSGTDTKDDQIRALADRGTTRGTTVEMDRFSGRAVSQSVLWGGLANLSTMIGNGSRVSFNGLYNRQADNDARVENGAFTADAVNVRISRMQYVQRSIYSGQLAGEHQIGTLQKIEWYATASGVRRYEPDRSEFVQVLEKDTPTGPVVPRWLSGGSGGAVRTFSDLTENSHEYSAKYSLDLGSAARFGSIKLGYLARTTARDAQSLSYSIAANPSLTTNAIRELPPEQLFDGRFTTASSKLFTFGPLSQGGSYIARDQIRAGFLMAEVPLSRSVRLIGGARYENDDLEVDAFSTLGSPVLTHKVWNDVLPSLALTMQLSNTQQLRLSASRTLARPEYRELSPIISRDVINGENLRGDETLERTNVTNADVRWELYPSSGEVLSIALFGKQFTNPIERVYGSGSGGTSFVFYTNAKSADNFGIEVELRKDLDGWFGKAFAPFSVFSNVTVMQSQIHLYPNTQASATNLSRRMVGQAPYVINSGVSYTSGNGKTSATLLFNRVGERITAAGGTPLPDVIEQPRNVMDFSLRLALSSNVTLRTDAKNLLDSPYEVIQGTVTRESYRTGRTVQAGLQWRP